MEPADPGIEACRKIGQDILNLVFLGGGLHLLFACVVGQRKACKYHKMLHICDELCIALFGKAICMTHVIMKLKSGSAYSELAS